MLIYTHAESPVVWGIAHRCEEEAHAILLDKCLASIRAIYPNHLIAIVDSDSPRKDHLATLCEKYQAILSPKQNPNRDCGAWKIIYENYQGGFYCFIHDGCRLVKPLGDTLNTDLSVYQIVYNEPRCWSGEQPGFRQRVLASLRETPWSVPERFLTVVGNIFFAKRHIVSNIYHKGFFNELPRNKFDTECWERRFGICFCQEGYTDMVLNNCIGAWADGFPPWAKMRKKWAARK